MSNNVEPIPFGFRIVGPCHNERRLVDYWSAFVAYCECDDRARIDEQGFLSPYQYDDEVRGRILDAGLRLDVRGFDGATWSRFLWFDIDDADLEAGLHRCRLLVSLVSERYGLDDTDLLVFFSGSKGFHVGLPTSLWRPVPASDFAGCCRGMAEYLATLSGIRIDAAIYQPVQPVRAPNSRHGKTGRCKRLVSVAELERLTAEAIRQRAANPLPFELPDPPTEHPQAVKDWQGVRGSLSRQAEAAKRAR